jgi:hypothetical protein
MSGEQRAGSPTGEGIGFRREINQASCYENNGHIHLAPCAGFPPPLPEREERSGIKVTVAG